MNKAIFLHVIFLSLNEVSVVFNISSAHSNTYYQIDVFYMNKFYHSNILDFRYLIRPTATINNTTYNHFYMNPRHLIIYTHTYIYYYSVFDLNFIYIYLTHVYAHTVHVELKILFHFPLTLS